MTDDELAKMGKMFKEKYPSLINKPSDFIYGYNVYKMVYTQLTAMVVTQIMRVCIGEEQAEKYVSAFIEINPDYGVWYEKVIYHKNSKVPFNVDLINAFAKV